MKVIDANTGLQLREGLTFQNVNGRNTVVKIIPGLFSATMIVSRNGGVPLAVPLQVRWTHPSFFGRHVAFLPS